MKIHCSQTYVPNRNTGAMFDHPMKLHCSQTCLANVQPNTWFDHPMKLHCSQTHTVYILKAVFV